MKARRELAKLEPLDSSIFRFFRHSVPVCACVILALCFSLSRATPRAVILSFAALFRFLDRCCSLTVGSVVGFISAAVYSDSFNNDGFVFWGNNENKGYMEYLGNVSCSPHKY